MKHLLYLKDDQIKDFIQLISYAYRETFSDPKEILAKISANHFQTTLATPLKCDLIVNT